MSSLIRNVNSKYSSGSTISVSKVAVSKPPMTTVAKGFCTSAPAPFENAIGKKPKLATVAVIKTGRNRKIVPCLMRSIGSLIELIFLILETRKAFNFPIKNY